MNKKMSISNNINDLIKLIRTLRSPQGCPWDRKQKAKDLGRYILEETYEVLDALDKNNHQSVKEELGDLLFQILFLTEIYEENKLFSLNDVIAEIKEKMIRRHPHVFGDKKVDSVQEVKKNWQIFKKAERAGEKRDVLFAHVPRSLPALKRAQKITAIASDVGFDWPDTQNVLKKMREELREISAALDSGNKKKINEELGDIIFTAVNLSRFAGVDAEAALTQTTNKFLRRFSRIEKRLSAQGKSLDEATLKEMDKIWNEAKEKER
ncbi:MAG: nucleoside triphosphate pyrophosphohydrolase [Syntrophaceae bacterium]|nr:nucleoside triphosphate pyrophosphohydrolase [Syntrophaceae bacterium]